MQTNGQNCSQIHPQVATQTYKVNGVFLSLHIYKHTEKCTWHLLLMMGQIPPSSKFIFSELQLNDHLSFLYWKWMWINWITSLLLSPLSTNESYISQKLPPNQSLLFLALLNRSQLVQARKIHNLFHIFSKFTSWILQ